MKKLLIVLLLVGGLSASLAFAGQPVDPQTRIQTYDCAHLERSYYFNLDALKALLEQYNYCLDYTKANPDIADRAYLCEFLYDHAGYVTRVINWISVEFKEKQCLAGSF